MKVQFYQSGQMLALFRRPTGYRHFVFYLKTLEFPHRMKVRNWGGRIVKSHFYVTAFLTQKIQISKTKIVLKYLYWILVWKTRKTIVLKHFIGKKLKKYFTKWLTRITLVQSNNMLSSDWPMLLHVTRDKQNLQANWKL